MLKRNAIALHESHNRLNCLGFSPSRRHCLAEGKDSVVRITISASPQDTRWTGRRRDNEAEQPVAKVKEAKRQTDRDE